MIGSGWVAPGTVASRTIATGTVISGIGQVAEAGIGQNWT